MATTAGRFRELLKKYGKVAVGVHFSVSAASITGLYIAIKNNVDVEPFLQKLGVSSSSTPDPDPPTRSENDLIVEDLPLPTTEQKRNSKVEAAATTWGALGLAVVCNKALFPIRAPITVALTPVVARFLARRRIIKNSV